MTEENLKHGLTGPLNMKMPTQKVRTAGVCVSVCLCVRVRGRVGVGACVRYVRKEEKKKETCYASLQHSLRQSRCSHYPCSAVLYRAFLPLDVQATGCGSRQ